MANDSLATVTDWLGREQPLARKSLELTTSGGGGGVTAPVTASAQQRAQAAQSVMHELPPTSGSRTAQDILAGISGARSVAQNASRLLPGASPVIDPTISEAATAAALPQAGGALRPPLDLGQAQEFQIPADVLSGASGGARVGAGATVPANQVSGGELSVGTETGTEAATQGVTGGLSSATQVLPYLAGAISIAQDAMSNQSNTLKAVDATIDAAGAVLSATTPTYGLPMLAASFVKEDINRTIPDIQSGNWARAVIADSFFNPITLVSDLVQLFGGPDLTKGVLGGTPKGTPFERGRENAVQFANKDLSDLASGYRRVTDLPSALQALQTQAGGVGVGLTLPPEISRWLGATSLADMNPEQFRRLLTYFQQDPSRIDQAVTSSANVPKLPGEMATQVQQNAGQMAKSFLTALVGAMPKPAPFEAPPAPPLNPSGPAGALGFAQDLLPAA